MHIDDLKNIHKILYPNDECEYSFDNFCIREVKINFWDGKPFFNVHVTFDKVKTIFKGHIAYIPCYEERQIPFMDFRTQFMEGPCEIPPEFLEKLKKASDLRNLNRPNHGYEDLLESLKNLSGLSENEIKQKAGIPL